jgi:hypothetical protein
MGRRSMYPTPNLTPSLRDYRLSMAIDVELFGQFAEGRSKVTTLNLVRPVTVRDVAILLGLDPEAVGLISVNGVQSPCLNASPVMIRWQISTPATASFVQESAPT